MLPFFHSFFNCLQIKIFALQKSIVLNKTYLQNAILSLMKIRTNIPSFHVNSEKISLFGKQFPVYHVYPNLKKFNLLSETLVSLGIMRDQIMTPLKPVNTIVLWCTSGVRGTLKWCPYYAEERQSVRQRVWVFPS